MKKSLYALRENEVIMFKCTFGYLLWFTDITWILFLISHAKHSEKEYILSLYYLEEKPNQPTNQTNKQKIPTNTDLNLET